MKPKKTVLAAAWALCCYGAAITTIIITFVLFFIIIDGQAAFAHSANLDHVSSLDDGKARTVMSYGELVLAVVPFTAALAGGIFFILFKKR